MQGYDGVRVFSPATRLYEDVRSALLQSAMLSPLHARVTTFAYLYRKTKGLTIDDRTSMRQ